MTDQLEGDSRMDSPTHEEEPLVAQRESPDPAGEFHDRVMAEGSSEAEMEGVPSDPQSLGNSALPTPLNTRDPTFLSKNSSIAICSEPGGGSRPPSFVSVNEASLLAGKIGALSQNSPMGDKPLVDEMGNVRPLSPKNVKLEQYYPGVDEHEQKWNDNHSNNKKPQSVGTLAIAARPSEGLDDSTTPAEGQHGRPPSTEGLQHEDGVHSGTQTEQTQENAANEETLEESESKDAKADVFPTAVGEDVIEAARARQTGLYDPPWMVREQYLPSLNEVVSNKAEEHFKNGLENATEGQFEKAIQCFNKAINLKTRDLRYYVQRGECFLHMAEFQSAILNYKRACVLDPENEELYNRLAFIYFFHGQCLFDQKLYPEALEAFSRATEMRPDVIGYHTRSIACLAALERHGECLALVNKRLEVEQQNADLYVMRARLHQLFRNTTLAYYDVKDALNIDSSHAEALAVMSRLEAKSVDLKNQAMQLNLLGRHRDALQKISLAIETNPSIAEYHIMRGALHRRLSDFNAAIDDYLLALDKTDHDEESATYLESQRQLLLTYNDFAVECFTKGYYEEAIILLNKAIKGEKREKGLYINRGDCFFKEGNLQFAMADYHQALELDGYDTSIRSRIALLHNEYGVQEFQDKNFQEAESRFSLAIQHNPRVGHYYISRCRTRQMMENLASARQDILIALLLDPNNVELMPILTRLFPGKSVKDILQSKLTSQARQALENLVVTASPVRLKTLANGSEGPSEGAVGGVVIMDSQPSGSGSLWQPQGGIPDIRSCMEDQEFNIKIAKERHRYNNKVKNILQNRGSLKQRPGKIQPLPPPIEHTSVKVQVQAPTGWRDFGLGIGVPDAAN